MRARLRKFCFAMDAVRPACTLLENAAGTFSHLSRDTASTVSSSPRSAILGALAVSPALVKIAENLRERKGFGGSEVDGTRFGKTAVNR